MADSSQKFIARNRAPRVQIEYDVELYGAEKKVQLPFVMGVMSDLLGKNNENQPPIADRKFLEIDVDNFDSRMKSMAPRAAFTVPNTLTGEGSMAIDLTFESMKDFSPGAIAAKVDALRPLLEARNQLQTLMAYMDGKSGAEELIERILKDPALLTALAATTSSSDADQAAALETLRDVELSTEKPDDSADVLAGLARQAPPDTQTHDATAEALASLSQAQPVASPAEDKTAAALASLAEATPDVAVEEKAEDAVLANLKEISVPIAEENEGIAGEVLSGLAQAVTDRIEDVGSAAEEILEGLAGLEPQETEAESQDAISDVLSSLERGETSVETEGEAIEQALDSLPDVPDQEREDPDDVMDVLSDLADQGSTEPEAEEEDPDLAAMLGELDLPEEGEASAADEAAAVLDSLGELDAPAAEADPEPLTDDILAEIAEASDEIAAQDPAEDELANVLSGLEPVEEADSTEADEDLHDLLEGLTANESDDTDAEQGLDDILAGLDIEDEPEASEAAEPGDILAELTVESDEAEAQPTEIGAEAALDSLLGDLDLDEASEAATAEEHLDNVLADLAPVAPQDPDPQSTEEAVGEDFDLDALLGDLGEEGNEPAPEDAEAETVEDTSDLDALLSDLDTDIDASEEDDSLGELDDLLGDLDAVSAEPEEAADLSEEPGLGSVAEDGEEPAPHLEESVFAYGTLTAARPSSEQLTRRRFRIALFGDFSGRSAKGQVETGAALAARPPILLDPDTVEDVIEGFASELVLPIGKDGAGIGVKLGEFDDLHPDELFENVELFSELVGLRKQLQSGVTVEHASRTLADWAAKHGTPLRAPKRQSAGNAVPADRRLSAFQQLIGDQGDTLRQASALEDLLARIVGPHIRALPDPDVASMQEAVDEALSDAMRLVLHHPEFQSLEAQWRSLDLIARSVEVDDSLEVVLYDVSAEELAADLAAQDDLTESGLTRLLTGAPMDPELGRGGYSALIGLYTFEETPPHAELLGRIARVAAHVDAPFFASLSPEFLKLDKKDRPPLVAEAWDTLQAMPEAGHLGLASPRFLLRRPYGAKSDPVDVFDFEEFTQSEGLRGMLWGNPVVLVTILLARSFSENGASMQLGSIMSLGGMPYHTVYDQFGDQVALPCTERNIDLDKIAMANARGVMAVSAVKGRDELRLTSFGSMAGGEILGPWTGVPAPEPSPPDPREATGPVSTESGAASDDEGADDLGLDDLGLDDLDLDSLGDSDSSEADDDLGDLDDLLASFSEVDDDAAAGEDDDEMDAELAALLADL